MDKYDYVFRWMKNATKAERHIDEMETFAKKHPIIFWKFHRASKGIIENDVNDEKYIKTKEDLTKLFDENEEDFKEIFDVIKTRFNY
jgi:hypothetical protein